MNKVYGYSKCTTVKKALKFLDDNNIQYQHIDNVVEKLSINQLQEFYNKSKLPLKKFFNTSGIKYKELKLKDKIPNISEAECLALLASDGMLVKRPILVSSKGVAVGFKEQEWLNLI
ncbi:MAG: Spx/MgsR family RNA polymerase-binding regulatory protein [Erysipelotrichaceae bacterium]